MEVYERVFHTPSEEKQGVSSYVTAGLAVICAGMGDGGRGGQRLTSLRLGMKWLTHLCVMLRVFIKCRCVKLLQTVMGLTGERGILHVLPALSIPPWQSNHLAGITVCLCLVLLAHCHLAPTVKVHSLYSAGPS